MLPRRYLQRKIVIRPFEAVGGLLFWVWRLEVIGLRSGGQIVRRFRALLADPFPPVIGQPALARRLPQRLGVMLQGQSTRCSADGTESLAPLHSQPVARRQGGLEVLAQHQ